MRALQDFGSLKRQLHEHQRNGQPPFSTPAVFNQACLLLRNIASRGAVGEEMYGARQART